MKYSLVTLVAVLSTFTFANALQYQGQITGMTDFKSKGDIKKSSHEAIKQEKQKYKDAKKQIKKNKKLEKQMFQLEKTYKKVYNKRAKLDCSDFACATVINPCPKECPESCEYHDSPNPCCPLLGTPVCTKT
ncbi:unnamed protein product [Rhizopus stolonifer]